MQCHSRVTYEPEKLAFGDGKHYFYIEFQCERMGDNKVCNKCRVKKEINGKESKFVDHGLVDEGYTEKSHIFDSPWYHKSVKAYGIPAKENLEKAMEAQKKVRAKKEGGGKGGVKPKVKRTYKKAASGSGTKTTTDTTEVVTSLPDKMVESMDEPLEVCETIQVVLTPFTHDGVKYWRDEHREKLYKDIEGKKGDYVGRWDSETIQDIPDSDDD